ncbi:MAG: DUF2333 family protein [Gammaproteobacteria bacterium]|nr:DUF2333 family protein [Gammaproteobacteria bacterium]
MFSAIWQRCRDLARLYHPKTLKQQGPIWAGVLAVATLMVVMLVLSWIWGSEPDQFNVHKTAAQRAAELQLEPVTGMVTVATTMEIVDILLEKPGGYLSNDVMPPGVWMDNMPSWEFGVIIQLRDMARALRNDMSRSQSQSLEDKDLAEAEPLFNFDNDSWLFPPTEREYAKGRKALGRYFVRLAKTDKGGAQFFSRADNLRDWLAVVEKRLGGMSQRLSASIGQIRINTNLAGDAEAREATPSPRVMVVKTPWLEIDDVFYEARGATWALSHLLQAMEYDFRDILQKKNALVSVRQIIRELEGAQQPVWSPVVLNGSGFGVVTNYSLIMASYISRANAAVIDLRNLLSQG